MLAHVLSFGIQIERGQQGESSIQYLSAIPTIAPSRVYEVSLFALYSRGVDPQLHVISGFMASDWHPNLSEGS